MSVDSRKKLTAFYDSGKVVVTSEFVNSMFGGLHGTSEGDIIASVDPNDPRVVGHLHDGVHADGHAAKINLENHVEGQLRNISLGDGAVRKSNIQCYPEALKHNAIPEFEVDPDTGEKCYYLNLDLPSGGGEPAKPAGSDTEIQFNDGGEFGSQPGYVFKKESQENKKDGSMGINVQDIERNLPYALSVYGDEQIYSDESLAESIDLSIVFDHPTNGRNWVIGGDGSYGIKKINDVIHFDSSFGRQAFIDRVNKHISDNILMELEVVLNDSPFLGEKYLHPDHHPRQFLAADLNLAKNKPQIQAMDGAIEFLDEAINAFPDPLPLEGTTLSALIERRLEVNNVYLDLIEKFKNFFNVMKDEETLLIPYDSSMGPKYINVASGNLETSDGVYQSALPNHNNGNHPWSTDKEIVPDDPDEIGKFFIYWIVFDLSNSRDSNLTRDVEFQKIVDDYSNLDRLRADIRVPLDTSSGRGTVRSDRWYKLSYSVKTNIGSAKLSIPNLFKTNKGNISTVAYITSKNLELDSDVGDHYLYFKSNPCLKKLETGGVYDDDFTDAVPSLLFQFISDSPGEIIELENLELSELVDGDLHISGIITGGGSRGLRLSEDGGLGIGLTRSEFWKHSTDVLKRQKYIDSFAERPQAELHIRGETGRLHYDPDDADDQRKNLWLTPVIIEDIPPCSWEQNGQERFVNDIRGTLVINESGRVYVNEKIKCESAGGGIQQLNGGQGELVFLGSGGILESDRAIAIDKFNLVNPSVTLIDSHDSDNPFSFSSFQFSSAEDDGTGTEVVSPLGSITYLRDNLVNLNPNQGITMSSSGGSSSTQFIPPSGMINIGTTRSFLGTQVGLRVSSERMVAIGDVESLHEVVLSSSVGTFGLDNGRKYKITENPNGFDFTQFGAPTSDVDQIFIYEGEDIQAGDPIFSDPSAKVGRVNDGHNNRTLEVVNVTPGKPPVRFGGLTIADQSSEVGPSLLVNSEGDLFESKGGAQFVKAKLHSSIPSIPSGSPVVMHSFDSLDGCMVVTTNGNGRMNAALNVSVSSSIGIDETVLGVSVESAQADEIFNVQIAGEFIGDARIFLPGLNGMTPPAQQTPGFVIPAGTHVRVFHDTTWQNRHFNTDIPSLVSGSPTETWIVPEFSTSGSAQGFINNSSGRATVGYLLEDIDLNTHLADAQLDTNSTGKMDGKQLIGMAKIFIDPR